MKTIKYNSRTKEVSTLCEMLFAQGYAVTISDYFSMAVHQAVKDFQLKNNLVSDGIVGEKTWAKLYEIHQKTLVNNSKFLSEKDLVDFAHLYQLELATIKAINEVESAGKGFLINGSPKILFEGHIFWKELVKRGVNPNKLTKGNENILYQTWTKKHYLGGVREHERLQKAIRISPTSISPEVALASASWGSFQIMGFHATSLGYSSITEFVEKMNISEREHLFAFGRFIKNHPADLVQLARDKNWDRFAYFYNGKSYKLNKYDEKLAKAYQKYKKQG